MEIGEFHWRDGWYFKRLDDGSVRAQKRERGHEDDNAAYTIQVIIPPSEWASIVAHVSKAGETSESYHGTLAFHMGQVGPQS